MTKQDLIALLSQSSGQPKKTVEDVLDHLGIAAGNAMIAGDEITLPGIGKLTVTEKAARKGRNPKTGEEIDIPAKRVPKFSAAKALKDAAA